MIMADNGSSMFLGGDPDDRWSNDDLSLLRQVTASDFEVLLIQPLYTPGNVPTGPNPTINSFTAHFVRRTGPARHPDLECDQWRVLRRFSCGRCHSRYQRHREPTLDDDVHALRYESVWPHHGAGYSDSALAARSCRQRGIVAETHDRSILSLNINQDSMDYGCKLLVSVFVVFSIMLWLKLAAGFLCSAIILAAQDLPLASRSLSC